jgi:DNA replication protein DnaC
MPSAKCRPFSVILGSKTVTIETVMNYLKSVSETNKPWFANFFNRISAPVADGKNGVEIDRKVTWDINKLKNQDLDAFKAMASSKWHQAYEKLNALPETKDRQWLKLYVRKQLDDETVANELAEVRYTRDRCLESPIADFTMSSLLFDLDRRQSAILATSFLKYCATHEAKVSILPAYWITDAFELLKEIAGCFKLDKDLETNSPSDVKKLMLCVDDPAVYSTNDRTRAYQFRDLIGAEEFKLHCFAALRDVSFYYNGLSYSRLNLCITGGTGSGKSTLAFKYATSIESYTGGRCKIMTASVLASEGLQELQSHVQDKKAVLVIDDLDQLDMNCRNELRLLQYLAHQMSSNQGLVVILTGSPEGIQKVFEKAQIGHHFPKKIQIKDLTNEELAEAAVQYCKKADMEIATEDLNLLVDRLGRMRDYTSGAFANFHSLYAALNQGIHRLFARLPADDAAKLEAGYTTECASLLKMTSGDVNSVHSLSTLDEIPAWQELQQMVGLESVKENLRRLYNIVKTNKERQRMQMPPLKVSMNRLFLGNPGTGKTTVARLYGLILKDLGLLSKGELITKKPADFIGQHLGQSESQTKSILRETVGNVLVIDEAYGLYGGGKRMHCFMSAHIA